VLANKAHLRYNFLVLGQLKSTGVKPDHDHLEMVPDLPENPDYWHALIDSGAAAEFCGTTSKTMETWRMKGGGPPYVRVSRKCIRYRRADMREWADTQIRKSTSDPGGAAA
jgi:hypothetical protein